MPRTDEAAPRRRYQKASTPESQIAFLTREFSRRPQCPVCTFPVSRFEATGTTPETYPFFDPGRAKPPACPHCGALLLLSLPIAGRAWTWVRIDAPRAVER